MGASRHARSAAVALASVTIMAHAVAPPSSRACTYAVELRLGEPVDGATGVPTNVVPWLHGYIGGSAVIVGDPTPSDGGAPDPQITIRLFDADENEVAISLVELRRGDDATHFVEVHPLSELAPNTTYTIEVTDFGGPEAFVFTTGEGPLELAPPALGELDMQIAENAHDSSCGDNTFACVAFSAEATVRATVTQAGAPASEHLWSWPSAFRYWQTPSASEAPFCIELRARNLAGQLGPASTVCSADARVFAVATTSPITCDGSRPVIEGGHPDTSDAGTPDAATTASPGGSGGCAVSSGDTSEWLPWLAFLALAVRRRRAAGRT